MSPRRRAATAAIVVALAAGAALAWAATDEGGPTPEPAAGGAADVPAPTPTTSSSPTTVARADPDRIEDHPCLARPEQMVLDGPQERFPGTTPLAPGLTIDARAATWSVPAARRGAQRYPFVVRSDHAELCLVGGTLRHDLDHATTTWSTWHDVGAAVSIASPRFHVVGTHLTNVGDGIAFSTDAATGWTVESVHIERAHDDCIENDSMQSGRILRSFFDGCYVFYSAQGPPGSTRDGSDELVEIRSSLVRMEAMPQVYRPETTPAPDHSVIFKQPPYPEWGRAPMLAIHDTVLRVDAIPAAGSVLGTLATNHDRDPSTPPVSYLASCSGNTIVWTVDAPFPDELPDCFELTTDTGVWDRAVAAWRADTGRSQ